MEPILKRKIKSVNCHVGQNVDGNVRLSFQIGAAGHCGDAILTEIGVVLIGNKSTVLVPFSNVQAVILENEDAPPVHILDKIGKK